MAQDGPRREELTRLVMAARPAPFWLDRPDAPAPREPLQGDVACDLAVIGAPGRSHAGRSRPPARPARCDIVPAIAGLSKSHISPVGPSRRLTIEATYPI